MTAPAASYIMERGEQLDPELLANQVDFLIMEATDLVIIYTNVPVLPAEVERIRFAALQIGTSLRSVVCMCTPEKQAEIALCREKIGDVLVQLDRCSSTIFPGKFFCVFAIW